jgi:RND family efflux transporter MFP subunit
MARIQPVAADATARLVDAQSEVDKARLALQQARSTFERVQKLAEVNAKSERELQEARFNMESAQAQYQAALTRSSHYQASGFELTTNLSGPNAKLEPATIVLRAPISGVVIDQLNVSLGEFIQIKQPLFKIHEPSGMGIEAKLPEAAAGRLGQAGDVRCELTGRPGHYYSIPGSNGGRLLFTGMTVDPQTRTIPLTYQVPNNEGRLRIGQAVHLQIAIDSAEQALAIPDSAVMEEDQRPVAFVQLGGETFEKRPLQLGIRYGQLVQVLDGLHPGERVVDQGAYAVRLAGISSGIPAHGHAH